MMKSEVQYNHLHKIINMLFGVWRVIHFFCHRPVQLWVSIQVVICLSTVQILLLLAQSLKQHKGRHDWQRFILIADGPATPYGSWSKNVTAGPLMMLYKYFNVKQWLTIVFTAISQFTGSHRNCAVYMQMEFRKSVHQKLPLKSIAGPCVHWNKWW